MPYPPGLFRLSLLLLSLMAGCALPPESRVHLSNPPERPPGGYAPSLWDRQGLEAQPRMTAYLDRLPADSSLTPGTTSWRELTDALPAKLGVVGRRHASAGGLLLALVDALGLSDGLGRAMWEQTQRIHWQEDRAIGVVMQWGLLGDAVLGVDYRLHMRQDARGWFIERLETRHHCGRGVTESDLCF